MNLVGYWPLNESSKDPSNPTAKDHSGNENHGTINDGGDSTVTGANGILGQKAYSFDGGNDYVKCSNRNDVLSQPESFTVSVWVNPATVDGSNWLENPIVYKNADTSANQDNYALGVTDSSFQMSMEATGGTDYQVNSSTTPQTGNWYHVVGVFDGTSQKLHVNTHENINDTGSFTPHTGTAPLQIGTNTLSNHGTIGYLDGRIQEVRIYNRVLTRREIQYLYQVGNRGRQITSKKNS